MRDDVQTDRFLAISSTKFRSGRVAEPIANAAKATDCDETLIHMVRIGEEKGVSTQLVLPGDRDVRKSRSTIKRFGKRLYATTMTVSTVLIVVIYLGAQLPILGLAKQIVSAEL